MAITDIIKYEGNNSALIWKHPKTDFNNGSKVIVHEAQEVFFLFNGELLERFGPGEHYIETGNLPVAKGLQRIATAGEKAFTAECYFVNYAVQMAIHWGTDTKVRLFDPASGMHIEIGASGDFNLKVIDGAKMLFKLMGASDSITRDDIINGGMGSGYFKTMIVTQVKAYLADTIKEKNTNILEIDSKLMELSEALKDKINTYLIDYGMEMPEFFVARVVTPDEDPNFRRLKEQYSTEYLNVREESIRKKIAEAEAERKRVEAETAARMKIIGAQGEADALRIQKQAEADAYRMKAEAEAMEMKMKGYTYQQETSRMVGMEALKDGIPTGSGSGGNVAGSMLSGVGELAGLGMTLGALGGVMGMAKDAVSPMMEMGKEMGSVVNQSINSTQDTSNMITCPSCGKQVAKAKFCMECGFKFGNFCPTCGNQLPEGAKFCMECGTKIQ